MKFSAVRYCALLLGCTLLSAFTFAADDGTKNKAANASAEGKFTPLFNGKDMDGWEGDTELWSVKDGVIVGSTDNKQIKKNSFLTYKKPYKNFVVKAKFRLRNGNSGIQYRSKLMPEHVVGGYQADIADNHFMGILYEEKGRGILANVKPEDVKPHVKPGEWNEYVITADGKNIKQELNGYTTITYEEKGEPKENPKGAKEAATEGIIALQIHVGPKMQIEFKDIEIQELP